MRFKYLCAFSLLAVSFAGAGEPAEIIPQESPPPIPIPSPNPIDVKPIEVKPVEMKPPENLTIQRLPLEIDEPGFKAKAVFPEGTAPLATAAPGQPAAPGYKKLFRREWTVPEEDGQPGSLVKEDAAETSRGEAAEAAKEQISPALAKVIAREKGNTKKNAKEMALAYQEVIKNERENAPAYYRLGLTFMRSNELVNAMNALDAAVVLDPKNTKYLCDAGLAALKAGNIDKAMRACYAASIKAPAVARYQSALGDCLSRNGNMPEALQAYSRASNLEPNNPEYIHNLAACNLRAGAFRKTIEIVEEAIRIRPTTSAYYCTRGLAYEQTRNIKQAQQDYQRAIVLDKQNAYAFYLLAGTYSDPDDPTFTNGYEAVMAASQAVKLTQERHAQYLMGLARALRASHDYDQAIVIAKQAVAMEPRDDYRMELAKLEKGKREGF